MAKYPKPSPEEMAAIRGEFAASFAKSRNRGHIWSVPRCKEKV